MDKWSAPDLSSEECDEFPLCPSGAWSLAWVGGNDEEDAYIFLVENSPPAHWDRALSLTGTPN